MRYSVCYEGQVQGVGFRWTVERYAREQKLSGWVRNLSNGQVELEIEGEKESVETFFQKLHAHMKSHIGHIDKKPMDPQGNMGFNIKATR